MDKLGGEGLVVHKEEVNVAGVVHEESLVAGGHHVASLLVGSETNLSSLISPCPCVGVGSWPLQKSIFNNFLLEPPIPGRSFPRTDGITI